MMDKALPFDRRAGGIQCFRPNKVVVICVLALLGCLIFFKAGDLPALRSEYAEYIPSTASSKSSSPSAPKTSKPSDQKAVTTTDDEWPIPNQVWQCYTTVGERNKTMTHDEALKKTKIGEHNAATWLPVDGNWTYSFVGTEAGEQFVRKHFADQPDVIKVYTQLNLPVMVSDFLRYLLLAGAGGVYADSDVAMVKPLHKWVPEQYKNVTRAMIGIEKDTATKDGGWTFRFVQHTMITAPNHPIMTNMVRNITDKMLDLERDNQTAIPDLELHDVDVVKITGPRGFMGIVFDHISQQIGQPITYHNLSGITEPQAFGDTLILPINFFAAGQGHSNSDGNSPDKLAQHYWSGTWRHWDESLQ